MLKHVRWLLVGFLYLPMSAHALPFLFDDSSQFSSQHTVAYNVPQYISSAFTFDLSITSDAYMAERYTEYTALQKIPDFVTEYVTPVSGLNKDFNRTDNGFGKSGNSFVYHDSFDINEDSIGDIGRKPALRSVYDLAFVKVSSVVVPEPGPLVLMFIGALALFLRRRFNAADL